MEMELQRQSPKEKQSEMAKPSPKEKQSEMAKPWLTG